MGYVIDIYMRGYNIDKAGFYGSSFGFCLTGKKIKYITFEASNSIIIFNIKIIEATTCTINWGNIYTIPIEILQN